MLAAIAAPAIMFLRVIDIVLPRGQGTPPCVLRASN
jgi:hypothetical protein